MADDTKKQVVLLAELLRSLNIDPAAYDVVLRGDGSGTSWPNACGFACAIQYLDREMPEVAYGAYGCGTSITAELEAYLIGLRHVELDKRRVVRPRVVIICDNQTVTYQGQGRYKIRSNGAGWAVVDYFRSLGWVIDWHWAPRNTEVGLEFCDRLSRMSRQALEAAARQIQS